MTSPPSTSEPRAAAWSAAASTASAWRSRSRTGSRTGRCGCPTACTGTCCALFTEALAGLRGLDAPLAGVGVDTWGVDYALLDGEGRVLGLPFHYRDARTDGMVARAHARVPAEELYAVTGIQTMPINTVFQLLADERTAVAERIALVPDLLSYWLTGELVNEITNASTTGLLDARAGTWARGLIERLGLPAAPFAGDPVEAGHDARPGARPPRHRGADVHLVGSHDTASAFVAAPIRGENAAILSSGTWSLLGLELDAPVLTDQAREFNLTNERGVDGTIRLLRNVMGLWIVQECRRCWGDLVRRADGAGRGRPRRRAAVRPRRRALPGAGRHARADRATRAPSGASRGRRAGGRRCARRSSRSPASTGSCSSGSSAPPGVEVEVVHVIGGGSRNELLCRLTADLLRRPVLAGPVEATALGNVLVQARAVGELGSLADMRAVAAASAEPVVYEPGGDAEDIYERFLAKEAVA